MFFLLRCVFWLTIVFSSMSWTVGATRPQPHALRDAALAGGVSLVQSAKGLTGFVRPRVDGPAQIEAMTRDSTILASTADAAIDEAKAWCSDSPSQCLADANRLTALVSANQADDTGGDTLNPVAASSVLYPVPHADPRRRSSVASH